MRIIAPHNEIQKSDYIVCLASLAVFQVSMFPHGLNKSGGASPLFCSTPQASQEDLPYGKMFLDCWSFNMSPQAQLNRQNQCSPGVFLPGKSAWLFNCDRWSLSTIQSQISAIDSSAREMADYSPVWRSERMHLVRSAPSNPTEWWAQADTLAVGHCECAEGRESSSEYGEG